MTEADGHVVFEKVKNGGRRFIVLPIPLFLLYCSVFLCFGMSMQNLGNASTGNKTLSVPAEIVIALVISSPVLMVLSLFLYKLVARFVRDKYRRKWVDQHLLPSLQQMSYREAIDLIAGRFEAPECSMCLDAFELEDETVTVLPGCNHIYRPNCIKGWLMKSTLLPTFPCCPICKSTIVITS